MQKRIDVKTRGIATIFRKDALQFVQRWQARWHKPEHVQGGWIKEIETVAACHPHWPAHMANEDLVGAYRQAPDLTAGLLDFLRQKWARLERTKTGRLKKFLSGNTATKWQPGFGARPDSLGYVSLWDLQDGELAVAFENSPGGGVVSIEDVVKARRWVAANQLAGKKFETKVLDKNEFLNLKHRLRRAK